MAAVHTPYEDRIVWRSTANGGEGQSRFGRYVHTRCDDDTFEVMFFGPNGTELMGERLTGDEAYHESVEHNKKLLGITGGESGPVTNCRKSTTAVCPECHEAHKGECM
jgi:hypothetical protein